MASSKKKTSPAEDLAAFLAAIEKMEQPDRSTATDLHRIALAACPELRPKVWYGMPAFYLGDKNICFYQSGLKFKTRYSTLGFNQGSNLDDGQLWPVAFALTEINAATEAQIRELIERAVRQ